MENKKIVEDVKIVEFPPEEGKEVMAAIDAVLLKFSGTIIAVPMIMPNGTIGASAQLLKKVKPVETGIPSPKEFQHGGEQTTDADKKAD